MTHQPQEKLQSILDRVRSGQYQPGRAAVAEAVLRNCVWIPPQDVSRRACVVPIRPRPSIAHQAAA